MRRRRENRATVEHALRGSRCTTTGRVVLEGGSIDVNGRGTMLTTEECLLSAVQARNPGFTREDHAREFFAIISAVTNVLWLNRGIAGDDTHGHVDDLARFVESDDGRHGGRRRSIGRELRAAAGKSRAPAGDEGSGWHGRCGSRRCRCRDRFIFDGQRLPASYANFYIANGIVLVPTFNDANDRIALDTLAALFPDRADCAELRAAIWCWGLARCIA